MKQILSVLVNNSSGVLSHVSGLFARRGYNIESLSVAATENPEKSVITLVVNEDDRMVAQIEKQLMKLVDVLEIDNLTYVESLERELVLAVIQMERRKREEILSLVDVFKGSVVDMTATSVMIEMIGNPRRIEAFIDAFSEYGIIKMARTGSVSLAFPSAGFENR